MADLKTENFIKTVEEAFKKVPQDYTLYVGYSDSEENILKPKADLPEYWHFKFFGYTDESKTVANYFLRHGYNESKHSGTSYGHPTSAFVYAKQSKEDIIIPVKNIEDEKGRGGCFSVVFLVIVFSALFTFIACR